MDRLVHICRRLRQVPLVIGLLVLVSGCQSTGVGLAAIDAAAEGKVGPLDSVPVRIAVLTPVYPSISTFGWVEIAPAAGEDPVVVSIDYSANASDLLSEFDTVAKVPPGQVLGIFWMRAKDDAENGTVEIRAALNNELTSPTKLQVKSLP